MPQATPRNGHSVAGLALRILAAALVAVVAIAARDLVDDSGPGGTAGSRVVDATIESKVLDKQMPVKVVIPPGARDGRRSLLVFLFGRGENEESYLNSEMFRALRKQGGKAPVVAFPSGDPDSYWHDRSSGDWGTYVRDEVVPQLVDRFDIEPERVAIGGISMGGFGALDIAASDPAAFCAVGAHSPAIWTDSSGTAPGAFDNSDDFDQHDVIGEVGPPASPLAGKRVWLDAGNDDPFLDADGELESALQAGDARVRFYEGQGGHETSYWNSNWKRYMQFYARALKKCQADHAPDHGRHGDGSPSGGVPSDGTGSGTGGGTGRTGSADGSPSGGVAAG